jgi:hypothetical protein
MGTIHPVHALIVCAICGPIFLEAVHPHDWPPHQHLPEGPGIVSQIPVNGPVAVSSNTRTVRPPTLDLGPRLADWTTSP